MELAIVVIQELQLQEFGQIKQIYRIQNYMQIKTKPPQLAVFICNSLLKNLVLLCFISFY